MKSKYEKLIKQRSKIVSQIAKIIKLIKEIKNDIDKHESQLILLSKQEVGIDKAYNFESTKLLYNIAKDKLNFLEKKLNKKIFEFEKIDNEIDDFVDNLEF